MKTTTARRARPASLSTRGLGSLPLSYLVVIAICGCVIAAGFLLAARQHFVSMDLGMKNSKLRKQLEDLETEQRRLVLAREVALSPREITRTARALGFADTLESSLSVAAVAPGAKPAAAIPASLKTTSKPEAAPGVTRTTFQRPVQPIASKLELTKKTGSQKPSKNG